MFQSSASTSRSLSFFPTASPFESEYVLPIVKGLFDYNHAFAAFVSATDQKQHTAMMIGAFTSHLKKMNVLFDNQKTIRVADLGCADSTACLGYLNQIEHTAGFDYLGFDINTKFLTEAEKILSESSMIKKHTLINDDVLAGELSAHPSVQPKSIDLIFASHLAYYLKDEEYGKKFIADMLSLLSDTGIAVFLHEDSTYYFRSTYNTNYKNSSAPSLLKNSAKNLLEIPGQFNELSFTSKLKFEKMSDELWQAAKNPALYKKFAYIPSFISNLQKLSFIVQCDLLKLAEEGSLSSFIHEMKELLEENDHCFNLVTSMQILVTSQNICIAEIDMALRAVENNVESVLSNETSSSTSTEPAFSMCYS